MTGPHGPDVLERAARANAAGRPAEAERLLRGLLADLAALPSTDSAAAVLIGRAYVTLALARHDQGDGREAAQLLRRAEQIPEPTGVVATLAGIQRAGIAGRAGRWQAALTALTTVAVAAGALGPRAQAVVALNSGLASQFLGRFEDSRRLLDQAVRIARQAGLDDLVAAATHNLGRLAFCQGDLVEALTLMAEAERISPDVRTSGIGLDRARVLLDAGLLDAADRALAEVATTATAGGLLADLAEADLERARHHLLQGRYRDAAAAAEGAGRAFRRLGATAWRRQAELLGLRAELAMLAEPAPARPPDTGPVPAPVSEDEPAPARDSEGSPAPMRCQDGLRASAPAPDGARLARRAAALARVLPTRSDAAEASLLAAEAAIIVGAHAKAARHLDAARAVGDVTLPVRLHQRLVAAGLDAQAGRTAEARRTLRAGLVALAREQGRYASMDTRTAVALHGRGLVRLDLAMALRSGRPEQVLMAAERWRGVSHRLPRVVPVADPELADLVGRTRQARLALSDADLDPTVRARLRADLIRWERATERRDWLVRSTDPARDQRATGLPASYAAIRDAVVASDARLVALFGHEGSLGAAVLDGTGCRISVLGPLTVFAELSSRVSADLRALNLAPDRLRLVVERSLTVSLNRIGELLSPAIGGAPAESMPTRTPAAASSRRTSRRRSTTHARSTAGTARLVILPTTPLAAVPWRMLPGLADVPVTVSPSATYWLRGRRARPERPRVVALAGPGLPRAAAEARSVARVWPGGSVRTGRSADAAALVAALHSADVVHLTAHGMHQDDSALFSVVRLADGPVFAHELQRAVGERTAGHVVLSACDVGRVALRPGEEALGLTAALQACGVRSVVAAVAPVRDDEAAPLMTRYHRALARGAEPSEALAATATEGMERLFCTYGSDW